jgi:uridylate kinase
MRDKPICRRAILKLSGEALAGDSGFGLDFAIMDRVCEAVKTCLAMGVEIGIVVGAGNFWRGAKNGNGTMERTRADYMGMLATVMNCLALADVFERHGVEARVQTALSIQAAAEPYSRSKADEHLKKGRVVIFGCGTGCPFFSTDTGAVLRAAELGADRILLAKNVDGVYSADPKKDPSARRYDMLRYEEVLDKRLAVMDGTATSLALETRIPVTVFALREPENIVRAVLGEPIGTIVE